MNTKKNVFKDSLVIGFAMFAVFFGAGNLVFPPQIGLVSGSSVFPAIIGLTLSGILFPMLAVAAVGNVGTNLEDICRHAHAKLHLAFMAVAILGVVFERFQDAAASLTKSGSAASSLRFSPQP